MVTRNRETQAPAYVSYQAFRRFLGTLAAGVDTQVERLAWDSRFGDKTSAQLLTALKFLDLLTPLNTPTAALHELARAGARRRTEVLADLLRAKYPSLLGVLRTGTRTQFEDTFRMTFETTGDTTRKSMSFLLHAAMDAGLPTSDSLLRGRRAAATSEAHRATPATGPAASPATERPVNATMQASNVPPALASLLSNLPQPGPMDAHQKETWLRAVEAVFDLLYPSAQGLPARNPEYYLALGN